MANYLDGQKRTRMSESLSIACDFYYDPFCEVCFESKDRNVQHEGFCKDCVQFLCEDCLRVHRRLEAARGHVIQKGEDMPKCMADKPPKYDYCDIHQQSRKDQFCGTHRVLLCNLCVPLQHNDCHVESVEDACKGVASSELDTLYDKVNAFKTNMSSVIDQIDINIIELAKQKFDILKEGQNIKDKTITKIEQLYKDITSETVSTYTSTIRDLARDKNKMNDVVIDLEATKAMIDKMKGNNVDTKLFLKIQGILKDVEHCKVDAEKLRPSAMNVKMAFTPDKLMEKLMSTPFQMGSVSLGTSQPKVAISLPEIAFPSRAKHSVPVSRDHCGLVPGGVSGQVVSKTKLSQKRTQLVTSYKTKLKEDKTNCEINGMAITKDGRRLMVDYANSKVKMFSPNMTPLYVLSTPVEIYDVAVTGDGEAVVSYDDAKLLKLSISDKKMSIKGTVKLPFTVRGIAPYRDKLLVNSISTSPPSVKLIDQNGVVYWSSETDKLGQQLFNCPGHVCCYNDGESAVLIVSDQHNDTLTVLNADTGDVIARRHVKGTVPRGVTADTEGNIFVCYNSTAEVAKFSKYLLRETCIVSKKNGLGSFPQAIAYNGVDQQLLVTNGFYDANKVGCFKLQ